MDIIVRDHAINWTWYAWLTVDGNVATVMRQDRFHKFDEQQGAGQHPETQWSWGVYRKMADTPEKRATWGDARVDEWRAHWEAQLAEEGLPADTEAKAYLTERATDGTLIRTLRVKVVYPAA